MKKQAKRGIAIGVAMIVGLAVGAPDRARAADATIFDILAGFSAKETCSCVFVTGQTDDYCGAFGQLQGYTVATTIDHTAKTTTAKFQSVTRTAHYDDGAGCTLDALP